MEKQHKTEHHQPQHHIHHKTHQDKKIKIDILKNLKSPKLIYPLVIILGLVLIINLFLTFGLKGVADKKIIEYEELMRPAEIQLAIIKDSACKDCFELSSITDAIKKNNVEITDTANLNIDSAKAKNLIDKYDIQKVPTVVVFGEIEKSGNMGLDKVNDALIFTKVEAPYTDAVSNKIMGRVSVTIINDKSCEECADLSSFILQLKQSGVAIVDEKIVDIKDADALISKYKLDKVPALIFSEDLAVYTLIAESWQISGTVEKDGSYILREINPPYFDLEENKVTGLVDVTYLTDKSCEDCYDVEIHKGILTSPRGFDIYLNSEKTVDISDSEGKALVKKYEIEGVPTILLSSEVSDYPSAQGLERFFTINDDGSYVFTNFEAMGNIVFNDLTQAG